MFESYPELCLWPEHMSNFNKTKTIIIYIKMFTWAVVVKVASTMLHHCSVIIITHFTCQWFSFCDWLLFCFCLLSLKLLHIWNQIIWSCIAASHESDIMEEGMKVTHTFIYILFCFFLPPAGIEIQLGGGGLSSLLSLLVLPPFHLFLHVFSPELNPSRWGFIASFGRRGRWIYKGSVCSPVDWLMLKCLTHKGAA